MSKLSAPQLYAILLTMLGLWVMADASGLGAGMAVIGIATFAVDTYIGRLLSTPDYAS